MENIKMRVEKRRDLTPSIAEFTLVPVGADVLPSCDPGAHITLETPSGAMRRYSLINDGSDPKEFVVAIKKEPNSRGGSASMHEQAAKEMGGAYTNRREVTGADGAPLSPLPNLDGLTTRQLEALLKDASDAEPVPPPEA